MNDIRIDEQLVADHLAGDRTALAGIYDRYADSLYDTAAAMLNDRHEAADVMQDVFLIAASRLDQLRDASRLKPWLFAILRNQVFTRSKKRRRTLATDFSAPEAPEMAAPIDPRADGEQLAYAELAELMRSAAAGLDERDQLVLEYSVRQDLTGNDLADALGVSLDQSYVVVSRMRDRVERTIGALTVARMGRKDCVQLGDVLKDWDGTFSVLIRKRVARHIEHCDTCERTKRTFAVIPMMGAAPALAAPPEMRGRILDLAGAATAVPAYRYGFDETGGFPSRIMGGRKRFVFVAIAIALVVLLLGGGIAIGLVGDGDGDRDDDEAIAAGDTTDTTAETESTEATAKTVPEPTDATGGTAADGPATTSTDGPPTTVVDTTIVDTSTTALPETTTTATQPVVVVTTAPKPAATVPPPPAAPAPTPVPPTAAPLAPGRLDISTGLINLGSAGTADVVTLSNSGEQPLDWSLTNGARPFGASATGGSLAPGQSVAVQFSIDRGAVGEGDAAHDAAIASSAGGGGVVQLRATVDRLPQVTIVQGAPGDTCPAFGPRTIIAGVSDESPLTSVVLSWSGPGSPGSTNMTPSGGNWSAPLGVEYVEGQWTYIVRAVDSRGNVGTATGTTTVVCPPPG